jgi:hypothetical protein
VKFVVMLNEEKHLLIALLLSSFAYTQDDMRLKFAVMLNEVKHLLMLCF